MPAQADQRLDLRDGCQDAGRFDRDNGQPRAAVATDAVSGQKIHLKIDRLWNDSTLLDRFTPMMVVSPAECD